MKIKNILVAVSLKFLVSHNFIDLFIALHISNQMIKAELATMLEWIKI